jgi:hypothetical protein
VLVEDSAAAALEAPAASEAAVTDEAKPCLADSPPPAEPEESRDVAPPAVTAAEPLTRHVDPLLDESDLSIAGLGDAVQGADDVAWNSDDGLEAFGDGDGFARGDGMVRPAAVDDEGDSESAASVHFEPRPEAEGGE